MTVLAVDTPEDATLDVVFVHGLDGDAQSSWSRESSSSFWPRWLAEDIPSLAVWSVGYEASSSRWRGRAMAMEDRAINLLAELQNHGIGNRPLCFVTHSMGGLLVKEMLLHAAEGRTDFANFADATKGVVFLGTPHTGSGLTKAVQALKILYRSTPAIRDLKRNSAHLRHLGDDYRDWSNQVGLRNLVFFEAYRTKGVRVVDEASANPGLAGVRPIPVDADHVDICKPADRTSVVYGQVLRLLSEIRKGREGSTSSSGSQEPLLVPIDELDAFDLEVHPAISQGTNVDGLPPLPIYVDRPHDLRLRQIVNSCESGESAAAVLVGGSSSGKTRAAWEAVRRLPKSWSLWHPLSPGRPKAVLDGLDEIPPRTVLWLNELQHYILTSPPEVGEEVAARLRVLLRDDGRAPILIIGTIWPEYLAKISAAPPGGDFDLHSQARSFVVPVEIKVPSSFSAAELETAREAGDPRLTQALSHSKAGEITQYLAGARALLERYESAPPAAQAVIKVAIDAQRLGYAENLSRSFLERAAAGYLSDNEWLALGDDWLDQALEYTAGKCHGAVGLLVRQRLRPGQGTEELPHFRLADYIAQWGRKVRCFEIPPVDFWEAGVEHISTAKGLVLLGEAAAIRWRVRYAVLLYQRAIDMGEPLALLRMGELEEKRGDSTLAIDFYLRGAHAGNLKAQLKLAEMLTLQGELTDAKKWLRAAADQGEFRALESLAEIAERAGEVPAAIELLQQAVELAGRLEASRPLRQLARLQESLGNDGEAETLRELSKAGFQTVVRRSLQDIAKRSGGMTMLKDELLAGVSEAQAEGRTARSSDLELLAEIYEEEGELDKAEAVADLAAEQGYPTVLLTLVAERFNRGNKKEAERLAQKAADAGDSYGLHELARCNPDDGRLQQLLEFGLEPDGQISPLPSDASDHR
ncbi:hypothetical protein HTS88_03950 [Pseudarthrobacter oxydans]|nr:hypothetical protein [Pseudarthrobacter oxydans]